ncbi:acetylglutamate kinase [Aliikangiella coralliicola]|uniref:Acetylglutamate kinase n=1 Tax=Aliikangiella coralliicola TaxID=2592383 RepID=A0A545UAD6_9GAMM|nr:acetylglutamate kinase [Aliikangiella coralliicola]TQV86373.1 acetylglutamate kinase [Aliikangiella coralliicola]
MASVQLKNSSMEATPSVAQSNPQIKDTIIQLLSNLAHPKEIEQYLKRFVGAGKTHFAVIKVGGAVLDNDLDNLCSSLAFLQQIGLFPIVVHGAGPQLNLKLEQANIVSEFIDGQRITTPSVLTVAKKTFVQQNLKLANRLQTMGVKTASITSGVFTANQSKNTQLGLVGEVSKIDLEPISMAIKSGAIPILSSLAETESGQCLNINADIATNQLAIALKPYKIIFLTESGGLLNEAGKVISSVNLVTEYNQLIQEPWLHGGMKLKVKQVAEILSQLPSTASVSITKPANLAKELFTHKGSGTLIRRGESIMVHDDSETIKKSKLRHLLESSFSKKLDDNYFEKTIINKAYITYCYRAAAVVTKLNDIPFLDKFVVADDAKGEGLGKAVWEKMTANIPQFFWRAKPDNQVNNFYYKKSDGCYKTDQWIIFWKGLTDFQQINNCVQLALNKEPTLN